MKSESKSNSDSQRELYDVSKRFENQLQELGRLDRPLEIFKNSRSWLGVGVAVTALVGAMAIRRAMKYRSVHPLNKAA